MYSSQPAPDTVRFDVYPDSLCVAVAPGSTLYGKADLTFVVARGNKLVVKADNFVADPINLSSLVTLYGSTNPFNVRGHLQFIAPVNTQVLAGTYTTIGYHLDLDDAGGQKKGWLNKTAMDSYMSVAGIAPF